MNLGCWFFCGVGIERHDIGNWGVDRMNAMDETSGIQLTLETLLCDEWKSLLISATAN